MGHWRWLFLSAVLLESFYDFLSQKFSDFFQYFKMPLLAIMKWKLSSVLDCVIPSQVYFGGSLGRLELYCWGNSTCNGNLSVGINIRVYFAKNITDMSIILSCTYNSIFWVPYQLLPCVLFLLWKQVVVLLQLKKKAPNTKINHMVILRCQKVNW